MNKVPYLVQEVNAALEVYLAGRTGQQYNRVVYILCDDFAELIGKLFLITDNPAWTDKGKGKPFKSFRDITAEVRSVFLAKRASDFAAITPILSRIESRRDRRNQFFHSTSLLDVNFHSRDCVDAFVDILEYGALAFPGVWETAASGAGTMETSEAIVRLDQKAFSNPSVAPKVNEIFRKWPRSGPSPRARGCEVTHHGDDLHMRMCVRNGGKALRDLLKALL